MIKNPHIDVERLIRDCGGVNAIVSFTPIGRTAVYSILRRKRMHTDQLASILSVFKTLEVKDYLVR